MRFSILGGLVPLLWLSVAGSRATDEPMSRTPAEKYQVLAKTYQQAQDVFSKAYSAAKTEEERQRVSKELGHQASASHYASQFLALIREHSKDPAALDAFRWMLRYIPNSRETDRAAETLLRHWIEDERLEGICKSLWHYSCPAGDRLLRAAIDKNPHRAVRGHARFSLAVSLRKQADRMADHPPAAREPLEREAEQLLQQVIDKYADLKHFTTLGQEAEAELFALRHLAVGKTPPDIEGEDLDGKKMKLTDFRGKVVLLTFWGSWCAPCMAEVPHERSLVKRLEGKPFAIVGVNSDKDPESARKVCAKERVSWRSFWDGGSTGGPIAGKWNVQSWPTLYLLDGNGVIRYKGDHLRSIGFRQGRDGKLEEFRYLDEAVERLMKEAATKTP